MEKRPKLIIIMGLSATGKTTLSRKIAETFNVPLINRDEIKVRIMDRLGWGDREWSKKIGQASYSLLDYITEQFARSNSTFILESDFAPEFANETFNRIHQNGYDIIQIVCSANDGVILNRWKERASQDKAHPSSTEGEQGLNELLGVLSRGQRQPLDVPGEIIYCDTSNSRDFESLTVIRQLQGLL